MENNFASKNIRLGKHVFTVYGLSEQDPYFKEIRDDYEKSFMELTSALLPTDAVCIDIGANIGMKTLFLSKHCYMGKVLAVEPAAQVVDCLALNLKANDISNVYLEKAAVGDKEGEVSFLSNTCWGYVDLNNTEPKVPMTTLEKLFHKHHLDRLDFIKIDVEGFEYPILKTAIDFLNQYNPYIFLEFNAWCQVAFSDVSPKEFLQWIFDNFAHVYIENAQQKVLAVDKTNPLGMLHKIMVEYNSPLTNFLITNRKIKGQAGCS